MDSSGLTLTIETSDPSLEDKLMSLVLTIEGLEKDTQIVPLEVLIQFSEGLEVVQTGLQDEE